MMMVMKDVFLKLMFNTQKLHIAFTMIYTFLLERMKIEKIEKLVGKLSNFKTSIKSWINIEKVHRVIKFNQKA